MDGTVVVGIAGLITTGGSAIWLRWLDNHRHTRQLAHERALADREELRRLLDEAAGLTRRAMWLHREVPELYRAPFPKVSDVIQQMKQFGEEVALMTGRLALRLGHDHEVTRAYDTTVDIYRRMLEQVQAGLPEGYVRIAIRRKRTAERTGDVLDDVEPEFVAARRKFIEAAQSIVGADLDALGPSSPGLSARSAT
jgi:hypothetical protein